MQQPQLTNNCMYNLLHTQFNEDFVKDIYFSYNLQYPTFYNLAGPFFFTSPQILSKINSTIKSDVYTFKNGLLKEQENYNNIAKQNDQPKNSYNVISDYAVTFNKNYILSTILSLMAFDNENDGPLYNELNNYNIDLITGKNLTLKDIFKDNIDYIKVIRDYINYKINQNKNFYYENITIEISENQAFYLTDDGIIMYFGLDEISPSKFGIPKFKMSFKKFAPYINPRFYCINNVNVSNYRNHFDKRNNI